MFVNTKHRKNNWCLGKVNRYGTHWDVNTPTPEFGRLITPRVLVCRGFQLIRNGTWQGKMEQICTKSWRKNQLLWKRRISFRLFYLAWENSRHLATVPLVSLPNDVWETSAEIPYSWRVTTQIWVVLLIGRAAWEIWFNSTNQKHYPDR